MLSTADSFCSEIHAVICNCVYHGIKEESVYGIRISVNTELHRVTLSRGQVFVSLSLMELFRARYPLLILSDMLRRLEGMQKAPYWF